MDISYELLPSDFPSLGEFFSARDNLINLLGQKGTMYFASAEHFVFESEDGGYEAYNMHWDQRYIFASHEHQLVKKEAVASVNMRAHEEDDRVIAREVYPIVDSYHSKICVIFDDDTRFEVQGSLGDDLDPIVYQTLMNLAFQAPKAERGTSLDEYC